MANTNSQRNEYLFLKKGGEMGSLMRGLDWSETALGDPAAWPQSLKTTLSIILNSKFPMFLFWGPEHICFYNDAYRPSLGKDGKHPSILGAKGIDAWQEIWGFIYPIIAGIMAGGEASWNVDQLLPIYRNGQMEDVYWTFSYSPVVDESGAIAGVFVTCSETTEKVNSLKSLQLSNEHLQESEARFRTMAEAADVLIAVGDDASDAIFFNKTWTDLTGKPLTDLLKFGWVDLLHPDDREEYVNIYLTAFKDRLPFTGEFRVLSKNESYRWLFAKNSPRFNPDGSFGGYISSCVDITDRKIWEKSLEEFADELQSVNEEMVSSNEELASANEELATTNDELAATNQELVKTQQQLQKTIAELALSESRFKTLIREAPVAIGVLNGRNLIIESGNELMLKIWGKPGSIIGEALTSALPELAGQPFLHILDNVYVSGTTFVGNEARAVIEHDGRLQEFFFDFIFQPLLNDAGNTSDIIVVAIDVTEKVFSRREIERTEESLRMAIEAAELGSYYINVIDRVFVPSPRLKEFFGFGPDEEVPYEAAIDQIHPDYRQAVADQVEASITSGVKFDMEYPVVGHNDGKIRWVRGIGTVQQDNESINRYFTGVLHEITERKQDEIRKNDFIGMVSHELKTPLTSLTAIIQLLNNKLKKNEDPFIPGALEKANIQVKKMGNMINGFLNVSRLESGKIMIDKHRFNLEKLIEEMIGETELMISSHVITFQRCDPVIVNADHDKIASVITNLISNAVKYSPKGKLIEVKCEIIDNSARVSIRDEGMGIKPQDRERLFERYYRVKNNHTQHISGFGIGLYLSAEIIHRHDGEIWVESESGVGSVFYFSLPL